MSRRLLISLILDILIQIGYTIIERRRSMSHIKAKEEAKDILREAISTKLDVWEEDDPMRYENIKLEEAQMIQQELRELARKINRILK